MVFLLLLEKSYVEFASRFAYFIPTINPTILTKHLLLSLKVLTWRIHNYGNDGIKEWKIRETFKNALEKWANVTNLAFKEIYTGEPDIWFKFVTGDHGDNSPFQMPHSRVIAHAFYPGYGTIGRYSLSF